MPKPIKTYSVCFLFTPDCRRVLLQRKARTGFAGRLNGVGGKIEPGETAFEGALREIKEEAGIGVARGFRWIGTLSLPWNCVNPGIPDNGPDDPACVLHYFAGIIPENETAATPDGSDEPVALYDVDRIARMPVDSVLLAGNGDLQYFIGQARKQLSPGFAENHA